MAWLTLITGQFAGVLVAAVKFAHVGDDLGDVLGGLADVAQLLSRLLGQVRQGARATIPSRP